MASLLGDLDAAQHAAVTTPSQLVAVLAGAGTGKTRVLTRRIAWRLQNEQADARHTLALSFTREAAGELRRRLRRLGLRQQITSGTFHAVMLAMLRQRAADHGLPAPHIVSSRHRLLSEVGAGKALDAIAGEADWCAARGIDPDDYEVKARLASRHPAPGFERTTEVLRLYAQVKRRRGVIDINDVLVESRRLLEHDATFADAVRWRFRHVHVDEAQDLNPIQHRLVHLLTHGHDDLYLVGDPAQAIYGFNGADPSLLVDVADHFPGIEIVRLGANHRCTPQVVAFGRHVLDAGGQPVAATSTRFDGPAVTSVSCQDEAHEQSVVAALLAGVDPIRVRTSDVAVLARTNVVADSLRTSLQASGVPIRRRIDAPGTPVARLLDDLGRTTSAARLRSFAHDVLDVVDPTANDAAATPGTASTTRDSRQREAERLVATAVLEFLRDYPEGTGAELLSWRNSTDPFATRDASGVEVLTFHAAKGREWHTVVLAAVETGLVPHRSATGLAARAEEARLLYVAATRARDRLIVISAARRGGYARQRSPLVDGFAFGDIDAVPAPSEIRRLVPRGAPTDPAEVALEAWRQRAARAAAIDPAALCSDRQLREIAATKPRTVAELVAATGLGTITAAALIDGIVDALDDVERV